MEIRQLATTKWTVKKPSTRKAKLVNLAQAKCPFCSKRARLLTSASTIIDANGCEHFTHRYSLITGNLEFITYEDNKKLTYKVTVKPIINPTQPGAFAAPEFDDTIRRFDNHDDNGNEIWILEADRDISRSLDLSDGVIEYEVIPSKPDIV